MSRFAEGEYIADARVSLYSCGSNPQFEGRAGRDPVRVGEGRGHLLKTLEMKNFTVFGEGRLDFSPGLNVIIGENGLGKTHLLKLPYAIMALSAELGKKKPPSPPSKKLLQPDMAEKLINVFRPEDLGRLARRKQGRNRCEARVGFTKPRCDLGFSFATQSKSEVVVEKLPSEWLDKAPVFLPTRELLTIYPGFVSLYEERRLAFEETWRDACALLGAPALRGPHEHKIREALDPLEDELGGKIVMKGDRFYLQGPGVGSMEMPLVAEGHRKLATLARLIATGSLLDKGCLFWDEPESNLNPKLIREICRALLHVCKSGVQVVAATHSLFLLRELDMLLKEETFANIGRRYFALGRGEAGVVVQQGGSVEEVEPLTLLDEQIMQSDRFLSDQFLEESA